MVTVNSVETAENEELKPNTVDLCDHDQMDLRENCSEKTKNKDFSKGELIFEFKSTKIK